MVFSVLESACYSQVSTVQQKAMTNLQEFESVDGFVSSLIQIIDAEQIPDCKLDCRLLAVITLKNVVSRCWKSRGSTVHLLNSTEKLFLKDFTLKRALGKEKDSRVLTQLSVLMAEVAKAEWPADWPQLLPSLFTDLKSASTENVYSSSDTNDAMVLFYSVLQELSMKAISSAKLEFKNSAIFMFPYFAKKLETLSLSLFSLLPECLGLDLNLRSESVNRANVLAEQLSVVTNIIDIFVSKIFATISATPDFARFFDFLLDQQMKLLSFLQCQSLDTLESLGTLADKCDVSLQTTSANESVDIDKIIGNIRKNPCDSREASLFILLLRISNITNKIASMPVALQKEHPLQMVPYLKSFLNIYHKELTDTFQPKHGASSRASKCFKVVLLLTKSSCISSALFISNTLSCKVYSTEMNTVAKLKEKLNFRFASSPGTNTDRQSCQVHIYYLFFVTPLICC